MYWDATYRVTTPLFLGGSDAGKNAELRPPSIKGVLRFWYRAIALPKLQNLEKVKSMEDTIFGNTEGQSSFMLSIHNIEGLAEIKTIDWRNLHGLRYLGFGVVNSRGEITRPYLKSGGSFTIRLRTKKEVPEETAFFLPLTLQALGLFGAVGARSRKGFGSLSLESLTCNDNAIWQAPTNVDELIKCQRRILREVRLKTGNNPLPEYTSFSNHSYIWILRTGSEATGLLNDVGFELLRYRSYGREKGTKHLLPDNSKAEQNFASDHDLVLDFCTGKRISTHPRRAVFGLPHNYYFKSTKHSANIVPTSKDYNRRASPLFIHIHALSQDSYAAVFTLLPAVFIPGEEKIKICKGRHQEVTVNCNVDYNDIANFPNRPAFSQSKVVVWP